jgi:hypothetical protein
MTWLGHITPGRRRHILDGDNDGRGGGHRWNSRNPGKMKFPRSWDDDKIINTIRDVATRPGRPPIRRDDDRWVCTGTRDNVDITVILDPDGAVRAAWPERGPGVTHNPE